MTALRYLQGYPPHLQQQVGVLLQQQRLGDYLAQRYPERHAVQSDKALYAHCLQLKQRFLRSAPAIDKVLYDSKLDVLRHALGGDWKGKLSPLLYLAGIGATLADARLGQALYALVALLWLIPDRRIEHELEH